MSDPVTAGLIIGGSLLSATASLQAGKAQQAANNFNADVADRNSELIESTERLEGQQALREMADFQKKFSSYQSATQMKFAYNGWLSNSGTAALVSLANASEAEETLATMAYNDEVNRGQIRESALQQRMEADLQRTYGKQARIASRFQAAGTLLQGGAQASAVLT